MSFYEKSSIQYDQVLRRQIVTSNDNIEELLLAVAATLGKKYVLYNKGLKAGKKFKFGSTVKSEFKRLSELIYAEIHNASNSSSLLSKRKNKSFLDRDFDNVDVASWIDRAVGDFTLKQRIVKYVNMYMLELEARIAISIAAGRSYKGYISDVKKKLKDPYTGLDVKNRSEWNASRLTKVFKAGTGTYVSAFLNLTRLNKTTISNSYRKTDYEIWKSQRMVIGIHVILSPFHPKYDICDELVGMYPKEYVHLGFHSNCLCIAVPVIKGVKILKMPLGPVDYMRKLGDSSFKNLQFYKENLKLWER